MARFTWMEDPEKIPEEKIAVREEADIVIIGAGHAGTCAARAAAEAGASVIVIEQQFETEQWILGMGEIGHIIPVKCLLWSRIRQGRNARSSARIHWKNWQRCFLRRNLTERIFSKP